MEDKEIIELYYARSEQAIAETDRRYGAYLRKVAENILHRPEDSEEIVSDSYLAAWNAIPPNQPRVLKHYLSRIVRNLSFKRFTYLHAEKRAADTEILLSELDECIPDSRKNMDEILAGQELGRSINRFLGSLPPADCALFVSRYYYAMAIGQLAEKYACSPRQIRYRLQKLRVQLNQHLEKEGVMI